MKAIRRAFQGTSPVPQVISAIILYAALTGVLVLHFGGTWANYLFGLLSFVVLGALILASHKSRIAAQKDHAPSREPED